MCVCVCVGWGVEGGGWGWAGVGWGVEGGTGGETLKGGAESTLLDLTVPVELQAWRYKLRAVSTGLSVK